jgi:hypothetical protein
MEAQNLTAEDPIDGRSMEARVARIESDVAHIRTDVAELRLDVREIRQDMKAINALESKLIKWIIGTVLTSAGLAFSIARFLS